ncbi:MAG TPA: ABC transporter permease [Bryobacteraceae bacterium]|nr:ABC transporter permease [Bryobacteraceae bacterium]
MLKLRGTLRSLSKNRGTTAVAICTLALAIGANTAIFSLLDAVALRSLPVPRPEQLVALGTSIPDSVNGDQPFSLPMFQEMTRRQPVFSELFTYNGSGMNTFQVAAHNITAAMAEVSGNYYRAMQIAPLIGRFIEPSDVTSGAGFSNQVAVISYRAWRSWFHGDSDVLGKIIRIGDHHPFTIIGVEPEGFSGLIIDGASDVTVPILALPQRGGMDLRDPHLLWMTLFGRLKPGITPAQARANLSLLWPRILEATPPADYTGGEKRARFFARRIKLEPAANGISFLRKRFSFSLKVLLALVGAVLLIACLNLANITLAKATAQRHESGVRSALGAGRWQMIQPALTESLALSVCGTLLGLALAWWGSRALLRLAWTGLVDTPLKPSLDLQVLAFTAVITVLSAVLFALPSGMHAARVDPIEALRNQTRSVRGNIGASNKILLIAQITLSLLLVTAAFLFGTTLNRFYKVDAGYRRDHLLTMMLFSQPGERGKPKTTAYYRQLSEAVRQVPGVESVTYSYSGPANEFESFEQVYPAMNGSPVQVVTDFVGPDFFHTMKMQVLAGREFSWRDDEKGEQIAIIGESLGQKLFGTSNPVGRFVYLGPHSHAVPLRIIGVVNSASLWKIESIHPLALYRPTTMGYSDADALMDIRTTVDPASIKAQAERVVSSFGRQYSLRTMTLEERLESSLSVQRLMALLATFFGGLALIISAVGLYGLMSFHVARRTSELGIRLALGAQRGQVLSMLLREALSLALIGCCLGLVASLFGARFIRSILFGVSATDPLILGSAIVTVLLVAASAALVPARRAARLDPMAALRVE